MDLKELTTGHSESEVLQLVILIREFAEAQIELANESLSIRSLEQESILRRIKDIVSKLRGPPWNISTDVLYLISENPDVWITECE